MSGIRIESSFFSKICDTLDDEDIAYSVWNAEAFLSENYTGPIDLECVNKTQWNRFVEIVKSIAFPTSHE